VCVAVHCTHNIATSVDNLASQREFWLVTLVSQACLGAMLKKRRICRWDMAHSINCTELTAC
jgi:hypothetical protein